MAMPSKVTLHQVSQSLMAVSIQNINFNSLTKGSTSHQMMSCTSVWAGNMTVFGYI